MEKKKKIWLAVVAVVVLVALVILAGGAYMMWGPKGAGTGDKSITVLVTAREGAEKEIEIRTNAEFLRGALEEQKLVQGDEGEFGLFVKTVDGVTVDDTKQEWWCFTKAGADVMTGVDNTPIANGDVFEITLKTGW